VDSIVDKWGPVVYPLWKQFAGRVDDAQAMYQGIVIAPGPGKGLLLWVSLSGSPHQVDQDTFLHWIS